MKFLMAVILFSSVAIAETSSTKRTLPVTNVQEQVKKDKVAQDKLKMLDKKEEDCDEKAKKPVEIKPESISLMGGTAGCTLE